MLDIGPDQLTPQHILDLVADRVPELQRIDYKSELPGRTDSARVDFLSDASSFANARVATFCLASRGNATPTVAARARQRRRLDLTASAPTKSCFASTACCETA